MRWRIYAWRSEGSEQHPQDRNRGADLRIGERSWGSGSRFIGMLDDLRYYDRELSGPRWLHPMVMETDVTVRTGNSSIKFETVTLTGYAPGTNNMFGATPITKLVTVSKAPLTVTGDDFSIITGAGLPRP